jgi:hypothetical protein
LNEPETNGPVVNKSAISEPVLNESVVNESVSIDSILNQPVMNEPVANRSAISEPALIESSVNESQIRQSNINQSQMYMNLSSNTSNSLPGTDQESNGTRNSSYPFVSRDINLSFDNHSSGFVALHQSLMNFASNSTEIHDGISQDRNGLAASVPPEFNNTNNEIYNQNDTSNLKTNNDTTQDKKAKNESGGTMLNQRNNITPNALVPSRNDISDYSVPDNAPNTTSVQVIISLEGNPNSAPTGKTLLANNSMSQFQEPKQNQTYNRNESKTNLDGSSISLLQQNNKKKVSTSSASAKPQESKKGRLTNSPNIRNLKVPTPS